MRIEVFTSGLLKANTYVVGPDTSSEVLVIDPSSGVRKVIDYIGQNKLRVVGIVNTHRHWDHISGNRALGRATGAPILMHEADADDAAKTSVWAMILRFRRAWTPPVDRRLVEGDAISVGACDFEVIHTPGHTPGGICLKYKKTLFTGDTLLAGSVGRTDMKYASWEDLSKSILDKIFVLSDDIACWPGHGPKTTIEVERRANIFVRHHPELIERWLIEMEMRRLKMEAERAKEKARAKP